MWLINRKMTVDAAERLPDSRRRLFSSVNLLTRWMTSRRLTGWESLSLLTSDQEQLQIYSPVYLIRALCGWHSCHPPPPACETNLFNPGCSGDHPHTQPPRSLLREAHELAHEDQRRFHHFLKVSLGVEGTGTGVVAAHPYWRNLANVTLESVYMSTSQESSNKRHVKFHRICQCFLC